MKHERAKLELGIRGQGRTGVGGRITNIKDPLKIYKTYLFRSFLKYPYM